MFIVAGAALYYWQWELNSRLKILCLMMGHRPALVPLTNLCSLHYPHTSMLGTKGHILITADLSVPSSHDIRWVGVKSIPGSHSFTRTASGELNIYRVTVSNLNISHQTQTHLLLNQILKMPVTPPKPPNIGCVWQRETRIKNILLLQNLPPLNL